MSGQETAVMWKETELFRQDMESVAGAEFLPWEKLRGKTVLVTGATGLIGSQVVSALLYAGAQKGLDLTVLALVRSPERAAMKFTGAERSSCALRFVVGTVEQLPEIAGPVDYVIHGASPTASAYFVQHPVETIQTAVSGTANLLELAREKKAQGFVYLSSMEVYGAPHSSEQIFETAGTNLDTMAIRSSYPEAKRLCETLCTAYSGEYGVPAVVVRLTQTFGPGVEAGDGRVFAQFAQFARDGQDIVLNTKGESERPYLYTADAAAAILTALLSGKPGEAYNAANPQTYCSIYEMAQMVAEQVASRSIRVVVREDPGKCTKYTPTHHVNLSVEKLMALGWKPTRSLPEMYRRMMECM